MKIAVFLGALDGNKEVYKIKAQELGKWIALSGNTLVYGASKKGTMGVIADAVLENGGKVIGVCVKYRMLNDSKHDNLTECIETETLTERRLKIIDIADAYIALPGGPGTLDEITEIVSLARLSENDKPCYLYDLDGFYQPLKDMFDMMLKTGFAIPEFFKNVVISDDFAIPYTRSSSIKAIVISTSSLAPLIVERCILSSL